MTGCFYGSNCRARPLAAGVVLAKINTYVGVAGPMETKQAQEWTEREERVRAEFHRKLDELRTIISDGIAYFYAWRGLMIENDDDAKALNRYRGFFLPAQAALRWTALIQLAKVFDRDRRAVSLSNLLQEAKSNPSLLTPYMPTQALEQVEAQVKANESVLKSLKHLRDTRLAHHDVIVPTSVPLPYGNVIQLVEDIKDMYNTLRYGHDRNYFSFGRLADDAEKHTTQVIRIMREEMDRAAQRLNQELAKLEGIKPESTTSARRELNMSWKSREFEDFIMWFSSSENSDETELRSRLASVPTENWSGMYARLGQALHDEGVKLLPDLDRPNYITEDDVNRRSSQADLIEIKKQILAEENGKRRS